MLHLKLSKTKQKKIEALTKRLARNRQKQTELHNQRVDLEYKLLLVKATKFEEKEERYGGTKKRPLMKKVKRMLWKEYFKDEDTGEEVGIKRSMVIEVEGRKSNGWRLLSEAKY